MRLKQGNIKNRIRDVIYTLDILNIHLTKEYIKGIYAANFKNNSYPNTWGEKRISNLIERDYFYLFVNILKSKYISNNMSAKGITEGYVYFLIHPLFPNTVKIGSTIDIEGRLSTYNTGCPKREYKIVYYFPSSSRVDDEREIQTNLNINRLEGEWFSLKVSRSICKEIASKYSKNAITF